MAFVTATEVWFSEDALTVRLSDGQEVSVPLARYPRLRDAIPAQRANWRLIANGVGINWPDVDEDLSVEGMLAH
jgi:Protein of unknown function (DUF2442)